MIRPFADPAPDARPRRRASAARMAGATPIDLIVMRAIAGRAARSRPCA